MKIRNFMLEGHIPKDVMFALIDHFSYSIKNIDSYAELSDEEKNIISEDTWNKMTYKY